MPRSEVITGLPSSAWGTPPSRSRTVGWALPTRNVIGVVHVTEVDVTLGGELASLTATCQYSVAPQLSAFGTVQVLPFPATQPEDCWTVHPPALFGVTSWNANQNSGLAGYPPGTAADALSCGVWVVTVLPGSGDCSLTWAANCWIVYAAQSSLPPSAEKYTPDGVSMSQQIVYEPGFSFGVTLSTVTDLPGATVVLKTTSWPFVSGVPVPVVSDAGKTSVPSP